MFTGLIEEVGRVSRIEPLESGFRLSIEAQRVLGDLGEGDSLALDGVCLTALHVTPEGLSADVSPETIARTNLGQMRVGTAVNLEPPAGPWDNG